jgi:hypothetical protein
VVEVVESANMKKRKYTERVRMTAEHAAYYGAITALAIKKPNATFEEVFKEVFPHGMPAHPDPEALKRKYRRAYELAR